MPSLIPASEATVFKTALADHFDTFKATITVNKEPAKTVTLTADQNIYAGYGAPKTQVTYTPVSQSFSAIVNYKENQPLEYQDELKVMIEKGDVRIKVEKDCKDYIDKGKTESVEINGSLFNVVSSDGSRFFIGQTYYVYYLEATT
jgi:hypothetical protein|tara:strand:- start:761 stop:1198 length:438 start_codon:yes stop_codon:yes gene_type:complete